MINKNIKELMLKNLDKLFEDFDEETRKNLFEVSLNTLNQELKNLKEALQKRDKDKILHFVHSIKGVFLNLQCNDLAEDFNDRKLKDLKIEELIEKVSKNIQKIT